MFFIATHRLLFTKTPKESSLMNNTPCVFTLWSTGQALAFLTGGQGEWRHTGRPLQESSEVNLVCQFGFIPKPTLGPYLLFLPSFPTFMVFYRVTSCPIFIPKQDSVETQKGNYFWFIIISPTPKSPHPGAKH